MYTKTIALGRLTKDPMERTYGQDGQGKMSIFTLAVDQGQDKTSYYDCIAFGKTAEIINEHFNKGRAMLVEGVFQNNNTTRDVNGTEVTNYGMNLLVNRFEFVDSPNQQNQQGGQQQRQQAPQQQQRQAPQQKAAPQQQAPQQGFTGFDGFGDDVPF